MTRKFRRSFEPGLKPDEPPAMSTRTVPSLHVRGNGIGRLEMAARLRFGRFQHKRGNDFQQPRGHQGNRHFHMPTISTPYGGPASAEHRRPAQAVGA